MLNLISYLRMGGNTALLAIIVLIMRIPMVCISLSVHESAHGWAAYKAGDPTAKNMGRITLNPLKHFDIMGSICMLVFGIGWAKPVPINSRYFKKPKRDIALTAAAGPLSNLILALISIILLRVFDCIFFDGIFISSGYSLESNMVNASLDMGTRLQVALLFFLYLSSFMNISLAIFNLIPIPPFDGSRIAFALLPDKFYFGVMKYERYFMIAFLILFYFSGSWLTPVVNFVYNGIYSLIHLIL